MSWFREKQKENVFFWIMNVIKMLFGIFGFDEICLFVCLFFSSNDEDEKGLRYMRLCGLKQNKKSHCLIDHFFSVAHINDCSIPINSSSDLSVKVCMTK